MYNGVNEFNFIVYTNGLTPIKNQNGSVSFYDPDKAEVVAEMMQVVCYDANNKFAGGDVVITEIKDGAIYGFTVVADLAFLTDESTAYPVSVDPSLSFTGTDAIEDAVVYSGKPAKNYADYKYNNIGYVDDSYKIGELLIKFPTLASNSTFSSLDVDDIISAVLTLYPASGGSGTETIKAYQYHGFWTESTVTWNTLDFFNPTIYLDTVTVPRSSLSATSFNITQAVKNWKTSNVSYVTPSNGIILFNDDLSDPDECRDFLSTEYASSHSGTGMPILEISYSVPTTVTVLLLDGDDDNNNVVEVYEFNNATFEAYIVLNGIQHNAGSLLTYESLDTYYADVTNPNTAEVRGINIGTVSIRATYNATPRAYGSISVKVMIAVTFSDTSELVFDPIESFNFDINVKAKVCGVTKNNDVGITYEIIARSGYNMDEDIIDFADIYDQISGIITISNLDSELRYPLGVLKVKASYTYYSKEYSCEFEVNVISSDYEAPNTNDIMGARYLKIPYPEGELPDIDTENTVAYIAEYYDDYGGFEDINKYYYYQDDWLINQNSDKFFELLRESKISVVITHGTDTGFVVNIEDENDPIIVTGADVLALPQGYFNASDLIILISCYAGDMNSSETDDNILGMNVVNALIEKGAKRVMGFYSTVEQSVVDAFITDFFAYLNTGNIDLSNNSISCANAMSSVLNTICSYYNNNLQTITSVVTDNYYALDGTEVGQKVYWAKNNSNIESRIAILVEEINEG